MYMQPYANIKGEWVKLESAETYIGDKPFDVWVDKNGLSALPDDFVKFKHKGTIYILHKSHFMFRSE